MLCKVNRKGGCTSPLLCHVWKPMSDETSKTVMVSERSGRCAIICVSALV